MRLLTLLLDRTLLGLSPRRGRAVDIALVAKPIELPLTTPHLPWMINPAHKKPLYENDDGCEVSGSSSFVVFLTHDRNPDLESLSDDCGEPGEALERKVVDKSRSDRKD